MSRHSKRESGVSPEQTRCCKAHQRLMCHRLDEATAPLMLLGVGRRHLSELSQKTCHDPFSISLQRGLCSTIRFWRGAFIRPWLQMTRKDATSLWLVEPLSR